MFRVGDVVVDVERPVFCANFTRHTILQDVFTVRYKLLSVV